MKKKDFVLSYFELDGKEGDESYYKLKEGYRCLFNDELSLDLVMVDNDGTYMGGDNFDLEEMQEHEWDFVSIHATNKIEYVEE